MGQYSMARKKGALRTGRGTTKSKRMVVPVVRIGVVFVSPLL